MTDTPTHPKTLGDYFDLQRGASYKSMLLDAPGPVLLGLATIARDGGFRSDSLRTYSGDSPDRMLLRPGDLYVSLKDVTQSGDLLGSVARVPPEVPLGRLTQDTVKLIFRDANAPREYLYWVMRSPEYRQHCRAHSTGTTNLGLSREDFLGFPVPDLTPARKRVVDLLEAIEQRIVVNHKMGSAIESIARTLFKSWFVDFDPVRLHALATSSSPVRARTLPKDLAALFPTRLVDSPIGEVPEGWRVGQLGEVMTLDKGLSYKGAFLSDVGVPMVNLGCLKGHGVFDANKLKHYTGEFAPRHLVRSRDLVIANTDITQNREVIGSPALVPPSAAGECLFTHHVFAARFETSMAAWKIYVYFLLLQETFRQRAAGYATGTTVLALPRDAVLQMSFPMPSEKLVERFTAIATPMIERQWTWAAENSNLIALREALLPKLISGGIRTTESVKIVGRAV